MIPEQREGRLEVWRCLTYMCSFEKDTVVVADIVLKEEEDIVGPKPL